MARTSDLFADLRLVLALRALERADLAGDFLPWSERRAWSREAGLDGLPEDPPAGRRLAKLAERVRIANGKRLPWSVRPLLLGLSGCNLPFAWVIVAAAGAFVLGLFSLQFGGERAVNLLGMPLILLLAWNAAVYLWHIARGISRWVLRRRPSTLAGMLATLRGARPAQARLARERGGDSAAWRDVAAYGHRAIAAWREPFVALAGPFLRHQVTGVMHGAAIMWALGAIAGLYHQGWSTSFHAFWESTLLDAGDVRVLFAALFAPASALFGLPLPLEQISPMQWTPGAGSMPASSALPWFNLYSATLVLGVVVPRLALVAVSAIDARLRLGRAVRDRVLRDYFNQVRGGAEDAPPSRDWVVVAGAEEVPVPVGTVTALQGWGADNRVFSGVEIVAMPPQASPEERRVVLIRADAILYGAERTPDDSVRAELVLLREAAAGGEERRVVFLEAARFLERFSGLPAGGDRWREREALWREAVGGDVLRLVILGGARGLPPGAEGTPAAS